MLNFQRWLEDNEIRSPQNIARRWMGRMPKPGAQNEKAVWEFVAMMAQEDFNRSLLHVIETREHVYDPRYRQPIEGNLLNTNTGLLGQAYGTIAYPQKAHFAFILEGDRRGDIVIEHPPVLFQQADKELLAGIIWHELRHAEDWAKGGISYQGPVPKPEFSMGKYARHILEARALADQLRQLLRRVGNVEEVIQMLSSDSIFAMDQKLHDTALHFMVMLMQKNEAVSWAAPLVTAASMMMPQTQAQPMPQQPAAITRPAENPARDAANLVRKLLSMFYFRNFVA